VIPDQSRNTVYYDDPICGAYGLTSEARLHFESQLSDKRKVASVLAERKVRGYSTEVRITAKDHAIPSETGDKWINYSIDHLLELYPKSPAEVFEESLNNLSRLVVHPSDRFLNEKGNCWLLYSYNSDSANYVLRQLIEMGYLRQFGMAPGKDGLVDVYEIAAKGWEKLANMRSTDASARRQAFVAMWFSETTECYYLQGIEPAIKEDGTRCVRIDLKEHNNKICDEIVAEIQRSRFVVADFTGNRGGVYFEAGFAQGLRIPVIWTVQEDHLKDVHFDTRQYNHITYRTAEELRTKLSHRIRATIP